MNVNSFTYCTGSSSLTAFKLQMVSYILIESLFQPFGKFFSSALDEDIIQIL